LVLVVGVEERKRPDIAIKFFCGAHKDSSVTELELIGPWRNEAYRQSCLRSIPQRLSNKIRFLGEMSFEQVQAKMAAATALLFASDQEGFPNVVIEAMAHNCVPIIIGADAGAREAIARGGGVALRESDELNWSELDRMIEAHVPYESARAQFDIALTARRHLELYKRLSSRKKTPSTTVRAISG
jgi:glycosyltransferase involved in cell wall biosynthesis